MNRRLQSVAALLVLVTTFAVAGSNPKKVVAVRTSVAPRIDGIMNEAQWKLAVPASGFLQQDPVEGAPAAQPTEIYVLYDNEALYFGCMMYDSDPSKIIGRLGRRDVDVIADVVAIRLDTYHDHQTAFEFTFNPSGSKIDQVLSNDEEEGDKSWDVVWELKTGITDKGWVAEVKIPFKVLRFTPGKSLDWGFQFVRRVSRLNERSMWVLIRKSESGFVSKFGHLVGLEDVPAPTNVELIPYAVGESRFVPKSPSYPDGREVTPNAGFDFKYTPGSGLTIDATFNPDFGQVEADPSVLNLSTYETFYPEKRPFFIEGSQIIRFTTFGGDFGPGLFYSRRIGRALDVEAPDGGYVLNRPRFATILGAAKISGKTESGLSIGVLEAVTRKETATMVYGDGHRADEVVEPLSNYSLIRLRQDLLENSNVGMIVTSVNRDGELPAMTAGLDWNLKFLESVYKIDGFLAGSRARNPLGERIDGSAGKLNFSKDGGPHWRGAVSFDFTSKKYNINDIGYFRRPNDYGWIGRLTYRDDIVRPVERFWSISTMYHLRRNFDGVEIIHSGSVDANITFSNYWDVNIDAQVDYGRYDDRETRGNGLYRKPSLRKLGISVESDRREIVVADVGADFGTDSRSGRYFAIGADIGIKAATNIGLNFEIGHEARKNEFAWADNYLDVPIDPLLPARTVTVFADRSSEEWSLTTRGSYIFSTELTLEVYFQLFFAKGKYENFHRMLAPDRFTPLPGHSKPDFNELAFNSNVVLRWEYLPGSTLFLVWSHARSGERGVFSTPFGDNFRNTFALPADNVLLLKASYWLSM
jgi:hypothetical protein